MERPKTFISSYLHELSAANRREERELWSSFVAKVREVWSEECEKSGCGSRYAEFFQLCAGAAFFLSARITLDDFAQFLYARRFLAHLNQSHAFFEASRSKFKTLWIIAQNLLVFADSLGLLALLIRDFTEIELGV
jgi:hypothetical protein